VVATGLGVAFGLVAKSKNDEALEPQNCPDSAHCLPRGLELTDDAKSASTVSTISFVAGGALLVGGAVLFFTAPRTERVHAMRWRALPRMGVRDAGLVFEGAFR
jgi:hypothetical protein